MDWAVSVAKNEESSKGENRKSLQQNIYFYLCFEPESYCWSSCVCAWGNYAVYGVWASSTAYPEVWSFLSELVISLSLSTPMLQPPRLSLTGRRSGGVWGKWWRHGTPTRFSSCSWHCVFLTRCVSWRFAFLLFFFFLNPLALAEFQLANWLQVQSTGAFAFEVMTRESCEMIDDCSGEP